MRSKMICIISIVVLMLFTTKSYANGGPMGSASIISGGNIDFQDQKDIELIYEKLDIDLDIDLATINVMYKLKNNGESVDCNYMFPVDAYISEFDTIPDVENVVSNFKMYDNGENLEYEAKEPIKIENTKYEEYYRETYRCNYISKLHFNKDEEKTLIVKYQVKPGYLDWATSKRFLTSYGDKIILYDLSPARHWGSGKIGLIEININYDKLIDKSPTFHIKPYDFKREKTGLFTYKKDDFEIGEKEILDISYDLENFYKSIFCEKSKMQLNEFKKISVSSSLNESGYSYDKEMILDQNLDTCWSEGITGFGKDEWIEFEFKKPIEIGLIGIINGFTKDKNTFNNNGLVKKLKVDIEFFDPINGSQAESKTHAFENNLYEELNKMYYGKFLDTVVDLGESYRKVSKVRLTILDAYEGEKYNDTCISEIYFLKPVSAENDYEYPPLEGKYSSDSDINKDTNTPVIPDETAENIVPTDNNIDKDTAIIPLAQDVSDENIVTANTSINKDTDTTPVVQDVSDELIVPTNNDINKNTDTIPVIQTISDEPIVPTDSNIDKNKSCVFIMIGIMIGSFVLGFVLRGRRK